jgi:hypothetical protein
MQSQCVEFVTKPNMPFPPIGTICTLYCLLQGSLTVMEWTREHPLFTSQIDVRRFIAYGVMNRILLRLHRYPVYFDSPHPDIPPVMAKMLNGLHHLDELCTKFHHSRRQLLDLLSAVDVKYILK